MVYAIQPAEMVEGFTRNTFTAMIEAFGNSHSWDDKSEAFDEGIRDLYRRLKRTGCLLYILQGN